MRTVLSSLGLGVACALSGGACGDDEGDRHGDGGATGATGATQGSSSSGEIQAASSGSTTGPSTSSGGGDAGGGGGEGGVTGMGGAGGGDGGSGGAGGAGGRGGSDCGGAVDDASVALSRGHVDVLAVSHLECDESLRLYVSDDTGIVLQDVRRADRVLIHGGDNALVAVPDERFTFLGAIGDLVYLFPRGPARGRGDGRHWPGYQAYGMQPGVAVDDDVTVHLEDVEGPGHVFLIGSPDDELTAPTIILSPTEGLNDAAFFASSHSHMNWVFTEPGLYRLSFRVSIVRGSDGSAAREWRGSSPSAGRRSATRNAGCRSSVAGWRSGRAGPDAHELPSPA